MRQSWMLLVCTALVALSPWPAFAAGPTKPVVTNKQRFRIPFRFDAAALQRMNARELQLLVSSNRGAKWDLAQSIPAQNGKFEFQAPGDGEYWFVVRTIDAQGTAVPPGPTFDPGLMVVVDTVKPRLDLQVQPQSAGKVQLSWTASDPNLDIATLRLESMQAGSIDWEAVSVIPRPTGQTTWSIPQTGLVSVRGTIADLAGNEVSAQGNAQVLGNGEAVPRPEVPDLRQPIANGTNLDLSSNDHLPNIPQITPSPAATTLPQVRPIPGNQLIGSNPAAMPDIVQERWPAVDSPTSEGGAFRNTARQRVIATRTFQLGYKVDDIGPSGVGGVELFITQDQGRRWFRYGEDADRTSPFDVAVPKDGDYGFSIRVRSGAGLSIDAPAPGEPPSINIVVDVTPPTLELMPIHQGQGAELNQISIRWRSQDAHPSDKPISLYYAPTPAGPWEPISGWRQDTGSYLWTVGPGAQSQFYIRIMARDAAGNVSKAETQTPVVVDLSRPTARIVDVEVHPSNSPR